MKPTQTKQNAEMKAILDEAQAAVQRLDTAVKNNPFGFADREESAFRMHLMCDSLKESAYLVRR